MAQDTHFSQLGQSQLLINPANAGFFDGYARATVNYRTQWNSGSAPYQTIMAAFDANAGIKKSRSAFFGVGGYIYQDKAASGAWKTLNADLIGNAVVNVGANSKLSGAIGAGIGQTSTNNNNQTPTVEGKELKEFNTTPTKSRKRIIENADRKKCLKNLHKGCIRKRY